MTNLPAMPTAASETGNLESKGGSYAEGLRAYIESVRALPMSQKVSDSRLEHHFECLMDWSVFDELSEVEKWFIEKRKNCPMQTEVIPLNEVRGWHADPATGNLAHESGDFFVVNGLRCTATNDQGGPTDWDQPILTQVGYDGGWKGILRMRFKGIPHYLIEAKAEPGNYAKLQLSPSVQAPFRSLGRAPRGNKPRFAKYFEEPEKHGATVLYDAWLSEDGGRLYHKRNMGILVEVPESTEIELPEGFIWMSMYQIKACLHQNAWINPHIRGIIAHL